MPKGTGDPRSGKAGGTSTPRPVDEKKLVVEYTKSFDTNFSELPHDLQERCRTAIETFIDSYLTRQFPKGLRIHKCGPFLSLSLSMNYRVFVLSIAGGIKFVFVGNHEDADRYLKRH